MEISWKGTLAETPFPLVFSKIAREKRSGVLSLADIETKKARKRIGFKSGNQIYVAGGTINETLGRLLLKWGKISEAQYHESLAVQKANNQRTGEVLIQMKIFDGRQLAEALQLQTEEKVLGCFAWPDGLYSFIEAAPPADKQLLFFQVRPEKIVMEGVRRYFNQERLNSALKQWQTIKFKRSAAFGEIQQRAAFLPREARIVQLFKDGYGLPEFLSASNLDPIETLRVLFAMAATGMIESPQSAAENQSAQQRRPVPQPPPPPQKSPTTEPKPAQPSGAAPKPQPKTAESSGSQFSIEGEGDSEHVEEATADRSLPKPSAKKPEVDPEAEKKRKELLDELVKYESIIKDGNYFELLGIGRDASAADIKKAFFRLAKKFHPDTNPELFKREFKERAEEVFTQVGGAYNTLIDQKAREEYVYALDHNISQEDIEKANRALEAEGIFVKAEVLYKKGDFRGAQTLIEEAISLNPEEPEYYIYFGWCVFKTTHGAAIGEARKNIQKSIDMGLREKIDLAKYYLGMFAKVEGKSVDEQRRYFAAAVEANPNNTLAASELRHLDMRGGKPAPDKDDDKKKSGLFGRFKK